MDKNKKNFVTLGLIPARGGSKGIKNKNLKLLNGKPLIAHTIEAALKSKLDRVIVATDSKKIREVAIKYGAECPFVRPKKISRDNSHAFEIYKYTLDWLKKKENYVPDALCTMLCTTPFRKPNIIDECLMKLKSNKYDWVFSVNEFEHHPYRAMVLGNQKMKPLFNVKNKKLWGNRQELPMLYRFNGGVISCLSKSVNQNKEYNIDNFKYKNTRVGYVIMKKRDALDIDEPIDLEFANYMIKNEK